MKIITGCPRSGTGFMSKLFSYAGIPCGHEQIYGCDVGYRTVNFEAESSWMAMPFLRRHKDIIHITRDPLKVISSLWGMEGLENIEDDYISFVYHHLPDIAEYSGLEKYMYFYTEWNKAIEKHTDNRYKLEDINKDKRKFISQFIEPEEIYVKEDYNGFVSRRKEEPPKLTLKDLPRGKVKRQFKKLSKRYGY